MADPYRIGIAGAGMGRMHAEAFHALGDWFSVRAVCDIDADRLRDFADQTQAEAVPRFEDLLGRDDLDIIDICTPSYLHPAQTLAALGAGKQVIVEKPAAGSLRDVDEMIAAEQVTGKRVMPIFQQRFGAGVQKLKFLQTKDLTGPAYLAVVETAWRRRKAYYATWHGRWQTELGGALATLGIHAHDVAMYVLGPAKRVSAQVQTLVNPIETEDTAAVALEMAHGGLATFAVTTGAAREITRHHFVFRSLTAESSHAPYANTSEPWSFSGDDSEIDRQIAVALQAFAPLPEGLVGQFYRYYHALRDDSPLPVTLQDARNAVELLTGIYASARSGRTVDLPFGRDDAYYGGWQPEEHPEKSESQEGAGGEAGPRQIQENNKKRGEP